MTAQNNLLASWKKLKNNKNISEALYQHFEYLANASTKKLLLSIVSRALKISVSRKQLIIDFGAGYKLVCSMPADLRKYRAYPESFKDVLKHHSLISLKSNGKVLSLGDNGLLDSDWYSETRFKNDQLFVPLADISDCWVFDPEKMKMGVSKVRFISHEGGGVGRLEKKSLSAIFIKLLAEALLVSEGEEGKKEIISKNKKLSRPSLKWKTNLSGRISSPPKAVNDELLIVMSEGALYSIKSSTGKKQWKKSVAASFFICYEGYVIYSTTTLKNPNSYKIIALNSEDGKEIWSIGYSFKSVKDARPFITPLSVVNKRLVFGSSGGELVEINLEKGKILKKHRVSRQAICKLCAVNNDLLIISTGSPNDPDVKQTLMGFSLNERNIIWQKTVNEVGTLGAYHENAYYTDERDIVGVEFNSGKEIWRYEEFNIETDFSFSGTTICYGSNVILYAVNTRGASGEIWSVAHNDMVKGDPLIINDTVYIGNEDTYLYAYYLKTGKLKWKFKTRDWVASAPLIVDDMLYCSAFDGFLYALSI